MAGFDDEEMNVYNDEAREELVDDDEISAEEEAFMKGYNEDRIGEDGKPKPDDDHDDEVPDF